VADELAIHSVGEPFRLRQTARVTDVAIVTITIKTARPREVARFWKDLLGYQVAPNHSTSVMLTAEGHPTLLIQPSENPPVPGAIHLDLRPQHQAHCVERALALGGTLASIGQTGDEGWIVMADPGGNLFCVLQSLGDFTEAMSADAGSETEID
jgi:Glyoxalase-like domain